MSHLEPQSYRERSPLRPPDHPPMQRLRKLGLRPDEEAQVYADYWAMTSAEKFDALERLTYLDDDELAQQIIEQRQEREGNVSLVGADTGGVPDGTVAEIIDWVGDDVARAQAALAIESRRHDPPRKTLVEQLENVAGRG